MSAEQSYQHNIPRTGLRVLLHRLHALGRGSIARIVADFADFADQADQADQADLSESDLVVDVGCRRPPRTPDLSEIR
jgi:hypothetical protein